MARVLIVEDNADAAEALSVLLEMAGHDVSVAYDPQAAVALARATLPDVALIDMELPLMDGVALARVLRKVPGGNNVRLVAVTGHGSTQYRIAATKAGFERFLLKPVDPKEIREVVCRPERRSQGGSLPRDSRR